MNVSYSTDTMSRQFTLFGWIRTYCIAVTGYRSREVEVMMDMTLHILRMLQFQLHLPYLFVYKLELLSWIYWISDTA